MTENIKQAALDAHRTKRGKLAITSKVAINGGEDLTKYYTPGVAYPCLEIRDDKALSYEYTSRGNMVAIVTDGTRILGLGNIGPEAGMPVMEGKAILLKKFGAVDAVPLAIDIHGEDEIVAFCKGIAPSFGAINLEDIETPKAVNILHKLEGSLEIPVFHDDSYGTGIVTYAALINALKLVKKGLKDVRIVINGIGSAGSGIAKVLLEAGAQDLVMCDTIGALYVGRQERMNPLKDELARSTNPRDVRGGLTDVVKGADVLIGASTRGAFTEEMIRSMANDPIVFALANPFPEMEYAEAKAAGARIAATGRSDTPNQVNNMLAFPGVFRGVLDVRARRVTGNMMIAAAEAMAKTVKKKDLSESSIIPAFGVGKNATKTTLAVAMAVAKAAIAEGVAENPSGLDGMKSRLHAALKNYSRIEKAIQKANTLI